MANSFLKRNMVKPGEAPLPLAGMLKPKPTSTSSAITELLNKFVSFLAGVEVHGGLSIYDWFNVYCHAIFSNGMAVTGDAAVTGAISGNTLEATVAIGTAPLIITSTTKVDNLNVDRVDDAHASATPTAATIPISDANGKLPAGWGGNASTLATLNASSLVVENPANATATPTASKIPIADGSGKLDGWITPVSNKESHVFLLLETVVI